MFTYSTYLHLRNNPDIYFFRIFVAVDVFAENVERPPVTKHFSPTLSIQG